MNKPLTALLLTLAIGAATVLPASAADAEDRIYSTIMLPVRVAALGTGVVVGTSVSAVKNSAEEISELTREIADELNSADDPVALAVASIPAVPLGLVLGVGQGLYEGTANAFEHSFDKPFSPESFSLNSEK